MHHRSERQIYRSCHHTPMPTLAPEPEMSTHAFSRGRSPNPHPLLLCDSDTQEWRRLRTPSPWGSRDLAFFDYVRSVASLANYNGGLSAPSPIQLADDALIQSSEGRACCADLVCEDSSNEPCLKFADVLQSSATVESVDDQQPIQASAGSAGHPICCAQPCKFVSTPRGCKDGTQCAHCHLCKWYRPINRK